MFHFIREICRFEIIGIAPERFLNIANRRRLPIFNVHCADGKMYGFIAASDYDTLSDAAAKAGVRLAVTDRRGLPYLMRHYRKRIGFVIGFGLFCAVLWYLSLFVWVLDVVNVPAEYAVSVSDALHTAGVRTGVLISSIDGPLLEFELEEALPQFDLVKVSCMGCHAQVHFTPSRREKRAVSGDTPCDLIATDGGEIVSVVADEGTPFAARGDIVYPGDVLVSGLFDGQGGGLSMVHARGEVTAIVEETFSETADFRQTVTEPTGRVVYINRILAMGMEIPLFGRLPQGNYTRINEEYPLRLLGLEIPIVLRREQWHELCYTEKSLSREECIAQAEAIIEQQIQNTEHREIISSYLTVNDLNGGVRVTKYVSFLKEISEERKILVDESH